MGTCFLLFLAGCTPAPVGVQPPFSKTQPAETGSLIESTNYPAASPTLSNQTKTPSYPTEAIITQTPTAVTQTPRPSGLKLCSPLQDIQISELLEPDLLKNPFQAPQPGMDDGHHGIDFAYWSRDGHAAMIGLPVYSVLRGRVVGLIHNRPPYGFAVIIETPLDELPPVWIEEIQAPTPAPTVQPASNLFCPSAPALFLENSTRSLYLLYAHLNQPPLVALQQVVECGEQLGEVGSTGKSVNAHLHLETRVGPAGVTFPEMAHYDNSASDLEMQTYCAWRVSGLFQMFDPALLFQSRTLQQ